jgi:tetratricopeptide (TPR) repeat protein
LIRQTTGTMPDGICSRPLSPEIRVYAVLTVGLIGLTACGRDANSYIERGNRFFSARKYDDADLLYRKALQKDPKSGDAHYRLALVDLERGNPAEAYSELGAAVDLMPESVPAAFQLGRLALNLYNSDPSHPAELFLRARTSASQLLGKQVTGYEGNILWGEIELTDRKPAEAATSLRTALRAKPGDPDATLGLARALVEDNQIDAGIDLARQLAGESKTFGPAYDFLFSQYLQAGNVADAENILKLKVANNPKQAALILELGRYYATAKRPADVAVTLERLTGNPDDFPDGFLLAGDFYAASGEPELALAEYQAPLSKAPKGKSVYRRKMAAILAAQKKWPGVYEQLQECLTENPDDQEAKYMRAVAWLDEGKPENLNPAIAELSAQAAARPQNAILHFQLGNALARRGNQDGARREWSSAARQNTLYLPPRFALAQMDLVQGKPLDALAVAEEAVAIAPLDEQSLALRVDCQIAAGQFQRARSELSRLIPEFPHSGSMRVAEGALALAEKRYPDAERIFEQLASSGVGDPSVVSGLTQALLGQKEPAKALQTLQEALKREPGSLNLRQVLAQAAMSTGKYDIAVEQYKQLVAATPSSVEIQRGLAAAYQARGSTAEAIGILEQTVQRDPPNAAALLDLARALYSAGRVADAKLQYRRLLKMQPDNPNALNDLSYLMVDSGEDPDAALALARKAMELATDEGLKTSLADTLGSIYLKKNMYDSALQSFQIAVNRNPGNMTFRYHLAATLYRMGNKSRARAELETALAAVPKSEDEPRIRELLARF